MQKGKAESAFEKPTLRDYLFMIVPPVLFVLIAVTGILYLRGPVPKPSPVQLIRDGAVKPGMTFSQTIKLLGEPKAIVEKEDGGMTLRYIHDTSVAFEQEDGFVEVNSSGYVTSVNVERSSPPPPPAD